MGGFFKVFGGVIGAFVLVAWLLSPFALYHFDRDAKATGLLHCHLWKVCQWDWPESPAAKAALAVSSLGQCQKNAAGDLRSIAAQNASLTVLAAAGSRATAQASKAVSEAQGALARASEARAAIAAPIPKVDGVCEAAKVVDQRLLESLR